MQEILEQFGFESTSLFGNMDLYVGNSRIVYINLTRGYQHNPENKWYGVLHGGCFNETYISSEKQLAILLEEAL